MSLGKVQVEAKQAILTMLSLFAHVLGDDDDQDLKTYTMSKFQAARLSRDLAFAALRSAGVGDF